MTDDIEKEKVHRDTVEEKNTSLEEQLKCVTLQGELEIGNKPQDADVVHEESNPRPTYDTDYITQEFTTKQEVDIKNDVNIRIKCYLASNIKFLQMSFVCLVFI